MFPPLQGEGEVLDERAGSAVVAKADAGERDFVHSAGLGFVILGGGCELLLHLGDPAVGRPETRDMPAKPGCSVNGGYEKKEGGQVCNRRPAIPNDGDESGGCHDAGQKLLDDPGGLRPKSPASLPSSRTVQFDEDAVSKAELSQEGHARRISALDTIELIRFQVKPGTKPTASQRDQEAHQKGTGREGQQSVGGKGVPNEEKPERYRHHQGRAGGDPPQCSGCCEGALERLFQLKDQASGVA